MLQSQSWQWLYGLIIWINNDFLSWQQVRYSNQQNDKTIYGEMTLSCAMPLSAAIRYTFCYCINHRNFVYWMYSVCLYGFSTSFCFFRNVFITLHPPSRHAVIAIIREGKHRHLHARRQLFCCIYYHCSRLM